MGTALRRTWADLEVLPVPVRLLNCLQGIPSGEVG